MRISEYKFRIIYCIKECSIGPTIDRILSVKSYKRFKVFTFFSYCVFEDLATRKIILNTKEQTELYLLEFNDQHKIEIIS